jgi:hypothetical protein
MGLPTEAPQSGGELGCSFRRHVARIGYSAPTMVFQPSTMFLTAAENESKLVGK